MIERYDYERSQRGSINVMEDLKQLIVHVRMVQRPHAISRDDANVQGAFACTVVSSRYHVHLVSVTCRVLSCSM